MSMAVQWVGAGLFGACVGSFLNVVVFRLPQKDPQRRSLGGRSHCPKCGQQIRWFDNVPVFGWLLLRGRARCCKERISPRYPLVELLTAALFLLLVAAAPAGEPLQGMPDGSLRVDGEALAAMAFQATFLALLVANAFIDFDTGLLLDVLNKPGMVIGVAGGLLAGVAGRFPVDPTFSPAIAGFLASLLGLLVGGGVTWAIRIVGEFVFRKESMGFGDVKYMAMIGAFVGWQGALVTMLLGCIVGSIVGGVQLSFGGGRVIRFGPFLAVGAVGAMFATRPILNLLFVTWPEWQRTSATAQWLLPVVAICSFLALIVLVRKGRRLG